MIQFEIDKTTLSATISSHTNMRIPILSHPNHYHVQFTETKPDIMLETLAKQDSETFFLFDENVHQLYFKHFSNRPFQSIRANEHHKSIESTLSFCEFLEQHTASKGSEVFVIGGGITQDIGGFACAIYKRGIKWHFIPTTLLAQTDSCIGAKTSLNFQKSKNILGLFASPASVMINTNFLTTLDPLEIYSGIGESFKLHLIGGAKTTALFEELLPACLQENHDTLKQLIFNSLVIKKAVIEYDEFEVNVRKALNYGHSFGHAIESLSNYAIPHGIAVTLGILIENEISRQLGYLDSELSERITRLALRFIPSSSLKTLCSLNFDNLLHLLKMDKKTKGIQLKLTCLKDLGNMCFNNITLDTTNERRLNETCVTVSDTLLQHSLKEKS